MRLCNVSLFDTPCLIDGWLHCWNVERYEIVEVYIKPSINVHFSCLPISNELSSAGVRQACSPSPLAVVLLRSPFFCQVTT